MDFEWVFNIDALFNSFDDDDFKESDIIMSGDLNFGYSFSQIPLKFTVGYGFWWFEKPVGERTEYIGIVTHEILEKLESWGHGGNLKLIFNF